MEPQIPNPNLAPGNSYEATNSLPRPEVAYSSPENMPATSPELPASPETYERRPLAQAPPSQSTASPALPVPPIPVAVPVVSTTGDATTPSVAADDDVIEKEWVNKAKKVVSDTKGDPYRQGHEVSKLQADYLQKRYGKQVKIPEDV